MGSRCNLSGSLPASIGELSCLRKLMVGKSGLSGALPGAALGKLKELHTLWLNHCNFSGPLPDEIGSLPKLTSIWVQVNKFTGPVPPSWSGLRSLRECWIEKNLLSGPTPAFLAELPKLTQLFLNFNQWSDCTPALASSIRAAAPAGCHVAVLDSDELPSPS